MWQIHYILAQEVARERHLEAEHAQLLRIAAEVRGGSVWFSGLRAKGAVAAAALARRLDDAAAHEAFAAHTAAEGSGPPLG